MPDNVTVKEVTTLRELREFIRLPNKLYQGNPYWVPSLFVDDYQCLRRDKNPAFDHCESKYWLAYRGGEIVGRIAAILNQKHVETWKQPYLRFGWVDFIDDSAVSTALFASVEAWAKSKGLTAMHGPLGFTDMDREGMLVEGFDELGTLATIYNFPYYPNHLDALGFIKEVDWVEYELTVTSEPDETIARIAEISAKRNHLRLLNIRKRKELLPYASELFEMLNNEYKELFGFVALTEKQIQHYIRQYFGFIIPDFVPIVLDVNGRIIAFGITMPSLSKSLQRSQGNLFPFGFLHILQAMKKGDRADLCLVAVRSEYQGKGVNAMLMNSMHQTFLRRGILKVETNPELETNIDVRGQWKHYQARQHKRRRCFIKHLS